MELGKLTKVPVREAWASESANFTPWLAEAENLEVLSEVIDIDLELEAQETAVGPFRADILCKDTLTGRWVLIENQLERTDHAHLGQLLTYAAGLKAATIVWIANPFTDEHRAALDWLNEITDPDFQFFGLELEVWRIGDSSPAPKFNLVSNPNDWSRDVAAGADRVRGGDLTADRQLQLKFWTSFSRLVEGADTKLRVTRPKPSHAVSLPIGRSGFHRAAIASTWSSSSESYDSGELRAELVINAAAAADYFSTLEAQRHEIEAELGYGLNWYSAPGVRRRRVFVRRDCRLADESEWPEQQQWLLDHLADLHRVFSSRVRDLAPAAHERATDEA